MEAWKTLGYILVPKDMKISGGSYVFPDGTRISVSFDRYRQMLGALLEGGGRTEATSDEIAAFNAELAKPQDLWLRYQKIPSSKIPDVALESRAQWKKWPISLEIGKKYIGIEVRKYEAKGSQAATEHLTGRMEEHGEPSEVAQQNHDWRSSEVTLRNLNTGGSSSDAY